ncbi:MAG: energy-coupling factor transporter transmembrane protein EcfT [Desulfovibrio sp.]|jgi:energy-coupling factor transport system permease protein|nr:energy-coupling factor transporter transmembrane protein EcfT [Desulfovibrio sp.]
MRASFLIKADTTFAAGLDARAKLLLCVAGSLAAVILSSPLSLGLLVALSTALALGAARPATVLKVYLFSAAMMLFALGCAAIIGLAVPDLMRWNVFSLIVPFLRMLLSVNLLLTLSLSTPVRELFARLQQIRLPGWLQIPLSVAVRFIPTFLEDCAQIRDAARLRPGGKITGMWRGLAVPLLFRMLYSADDLAMAAELKGISAAYRGQRAPLPALKTRDRSVLALAFAALCAAAALQYFGPNFRPLPM